ncbi:hypothetical protein GFH48_02315 [Streptomyces fagopyri]|uniref:Ricin B lectin domain-containing protein n=1 Tax=Streptomyces fagopyri TaxID=2662397 RepID=A0A5Q0L652_9ACTN|nr:hypothetical protein [Streptomyces fagopyri]QFZ72244.1 hypothetical protein GFH48_02315 [Streptomyces fagopyri]
MPALAAAAAPTGTAFTFTAPTAAAGSTVPHEPTYGSKILLRNQYLGDSGYLDTNGLSGQHGAAYDVSTDQTPNSRGPKTSAWKVVSATGKADGSRVTSGDVVHLVNQYSSGTCLDTNGRSARSGAKFDVSTTADGNRGRGTSKWHIFGKAPSPSDGHLRTDDVVNLLNDYGSANGGFLDVNGLSSRQGGAKYDVSTSHYSDRGPGTGSWKVRQAS